MVDLGAVASIQGQVAEEISRQTKLVDELDNIIIKLEERLLEVLTIPVPPSNEKTAIKESNLVPLAAQLAAINNLLTDRCVSLDSLIQRIQI